MTDPARPPFVPQIRLYQDWLARTHGLIFTSYAALWDWSISDLEGFWRSVWDYSDMQSPTPFEAALVEERMPGAVWFHGAQVNYAWQVLRHVPPAEMAGMPAIVSDDETGNARTLSWPELQRQVASFALILKDLGIGRGDRVAAYLPNVPETVVAFLACASIGAIWSLCAPDMGVQAVTDRFRQIEPKVLIAADGVVYAGKAQDRSAIVAQLRAALPSVNALILLETAQAAARLPAEHRFAEAVARNDAAVAAFEPEWLPFDQPLWILYSSGTTGLPKAIVHTHGGILLTAYAGVLHMDGGASYSSNNWGERAHWYTSTGWVMWNSQIGGLLGGTTICLFDGSPSGSKEVPDWGVLFRFATRAKVTTFGAGAAFYASAMKAGLPLADCGDLSAIRVLGSTGSPLPEEVQRWGSAQFASVGTPDIWWCNISGGTDLCGNFCTGNRELPLRYGEMQCRQLGASVQAWDDAGRPVIDAVGELVCTRPIPGMPSRLWADADGARLRDSYFDMFPGVWRHGDWLRITPQGGCTIYGRSDATLNRHGLRMGTSELYAAVEALPEVLDSLVIDLEHLGRDSRMILFVTPRPGVAFSEDLTAKIAAAIRAALSPRFLPDEIVAAPEIPRTLSGKKQEVPIKRLFLGHPAEAVLSRDAMANPSCLDWYVDTAKHYLDH